jgi:hypothetical protein
MIFRRADPQKTEPEQAPQLTPDLCRRARGIGWLTEMMLAERSGVPRDVIMDFESGTRALEAAEVIAIRRVFESVGVEFVEDGDGPRVRLRR